MQQKSVPITIEKIEKRTPPRVPSCKMPAQKESAHDISLFRINLFAKPTYIVVNFSALEDSTSSSSSKKIDLYAYMLKNDDAGARARGSAYYDALYHHHRTIIISMIPRLATMLRDHRAAGRLTPAIETTAG